MKIKTPTIKQLNQAQVVMMDLIIKEVKVVKTLVVMSKARN